MIAFDEVSFQDEEGFKTVQVRGLSLFQLLGIYRTFKPTVEALYRASVNSDIEDFDTADVALKLMIESEPLSMYVIACGIGGLSQLELAKSLPAAVQLYVLCKAITLTVRMEGGLGKLLEGVVGMMSVLQSEMNVLKQQSNG